MDHSTYLAKTLATLILKSGLSPNENGHDHPRCGYRVRGQRLGPMNGQI